ncbi:SusC/RagA family TonB-linked outer membrane protein [Aquimarina algiphila]|uniref:SusC/RagA family TonB-linked outer membrane protein n=1 Tax=Aquimarina algiphila TaxID=2047982 RepID=UPI002330B9C2|nr:TonB-dependent receptor [Aquimarina algiphila]
MKSRILKKLIFLLVFLSGSMMFAQITVSGVISDTGGPIPGVNVLVRGTTNGAVSDFDGNYTLDNVAEDAILVFSFVGFKSQEISVNGQSTINITMEEDAAELEQVVVVGYGTVRKKDLTGAVATVKPEDFNQGVQTSPDQLIQGRVAGVNITQSSGEPGAGSSIRIRGASSIRAGNNPLIVVDGIPLTDSDVSPGSDTGIGSSSSRNPLNFINPNDIASIDVLKDASATAIYGSRGSNGVIIITTKKGKSGKPQMTFSASTSVGSIANEYDLLSGNAFVQAANGAGNPGADLGGNVDAFDEILRSAIIQNYDFSYGGGSETGNYRISLGLLDQEGIIKGTGQKKYNATVNLSEKFFNNKLKIDARVLTSFIQDDAEAISDNVGAEGDLVSSALKWNPTRNFRSADGSFDQPSDNQRNPLALLEYYDDRTETSRIFGNISATYEIIEGLNYKFNFGVDRSEATRGVEQSRLLFTNNTIDRGRADVLTLKTFNKLFEHTLSYNKDLSENLRLDAVIGYSFQQFERKGTNTTAFDFASDDQRRYIDNLNSAATFPTGISNPDLNTFFNSSFFDPTSELQSFFGRANLNLRDKYLLTATLRADGSSRFGSGNEYGYFPSAAFAWKIINEDFTPDLFSDLKFRLGWGITGNQAFPAGSAQEQFGFIRTTDPVTLETISIVAQINAANPDLQWESTSTINAGIDFGFFDNRLSGSIDYFNKVTKDVLFRFPTVQPAVPNSFFWRNLDNTEIINTGIELGINAVLVQKEDLTVDVGINLSFLDNKIENVTQDNFINGIITGSISGQGLSGQNAQLLFDDQPLFAFYLPIFEGFDSAGAPIFADINNDGVINTDFGTPGTTDRAFVGDPNPDILIGIRGAVSYKDFDASVYLNGAYGHEIYDNTANALFTSAALRRGENVTEDIVGNGEDPGSPNTVSTRFLQSGDFLRLTNLTLGYTIRGSEENALTNWFNSLRVSVTGQNLFVITPYDGFDPEVNTNKQVDGVPSFGIDYTAFPRSRQFTLGINMIF